MGMMRNSCLDSPFFSGEMEGKLSLCSPVFYTALPSDILKAVKKLRNKKVLFPELSTSHTVWKASPELCKHFTYIIFLPTGLGV